MRELTLTRPDDWHLHLRDGAAMAAVVGFTAREFGRAIIMPNLKPPVVDTDGAWAYRDRIMDAVPEGLSFEPLMTLYLTDNTSPDEISRARASGIVHGCEALSGRCDDEFRFRGDQHSSHGACFRCHGR